MTEKRFPIQGGLTMRHARTGEWDGTVPWSVAEKAFEGYAERFPSSARDQPLERLAQRGGFGHGEMDTFTGSHDWYEHFQPSKLSLEKKTYYKERYGVGLG